MRHSHKWLHTSFSAYHGPAHLTCLCQGDLYVYRYFIRVDLNVVLDFPPWRLPFLGTHWIACLAERSAVRLTRSVCPNILIILFRVVAESSFCLGIIRSSSLIRPVRSSVRALTPCQMIHCFFCLILKQNSSCFFLSRRLTRKYSVVCWSPPSSCPTSARIWHRGNGTTTSWEGGGQTRICACVFAHAPY